MKPSPGRWPLLFLAVAAVLLAADTGLASVPSRSSQEDEIEEASFLLDDALDFARGMQSADALEFLGEAIALLVEVLDASEEPPEDALAQMYRASRLIDEMSNAVDEGLADPLDQLVRAYEAHLDAEHPDRLYAAAVRAFQARDIATALPLLAREVQARSRTSSPEDPALLHARRALAVSLCFAGRPLEGKAALEDVVRLHRTAPAEDPAEFLMALENLGVVLGMLGQAKASRAAYEEVLRRREEWLDSDHPLVAMTRANIAANASNTGDNEVARTLFEQSLAVFEKTLPADHRLVVSTRINLGSARLALGDLEGAREILQAGLDGADSPIEESPELQMGLAHLASTFWQLGDNQRARELCERVVPLVQDLPPTHSMRRYVRGVLGFVLMAQGDRDGARFQMEELVAAEALTRDQNPFLYQVALANLAATIDDPVEAGLLFQEAVEVFRASEDPRAIAALNNHATLLSEQGDLQGARALLDEALELAARILPPRHRMHSAIAVNLGATTWRAGRPDEARAIVERSLAERLEWMAPDDEDVCELRLNAATLALRHGDREASREHVPAMLDSMEGRLGRLATLSPREAAGIARSLDEELMLLLELTVGEGGEVGRRVFEMIESRRHAATGTPLVLGTDPSSEVEGWRRRAAEVRRRLSALVTAGGAADLSDFPSRVRSLTEERDRLEAKIRTALIDAGRFSGTLRLDRLVGALAPGEAAVGFLRYRRPSGAGGDRMLAHVVRSDGALVRVELGSVRELEELVPSWRHAIGSSLLRGVRPRSGGATVESGTPRALTRALVEPVLTAASVDGVAPDRLFVCHDDFGHLVPLDALPLGEGFVGDALEIVVQTSFAGLVAPPPASESAPRLLAIGEPRYGAGPAPAVAPAASEARSSALGMFAPLPQTRAEVDAVGRRFEEHFEVSPRILVGEAASKQALVDAAPGTRFLHVATHGWFAPESVPSAAEEGPAARRWTPMDPQAAVRGLAPMALCGLALAGANLGSDEVGRVRGIITAEEIAGLDLSGCELAVLSACETNVGIRRAGLGIVSLQTALHDAGARTAITSLWKVDDEATRRLFEHFYGALWEEGKSRAEALWQAKRRLRDEGAPVRDWGAWVLTGAAD